MSYRELRNFTERMKALGYPRIISMDNFRTPNFELVADILYWLLKRYDPNAKNTQGKEIVDDIETESQRVAFVRDTCQLFSTKARLKINAKKVYGSDGLAARELLKIAEMMYQAQTNQQKAGGSMAHAHADPDFNLANRTSDMKMARELTGEITECGLRLFELLKNEEANKKVRANAINLLYSGDLDMDKVEGEINKMTGSLRSESERMEDLCKKLQEDEESLQEKISKKQADLDRCKKRLKDLENVRPAFMDEFEKLEKELSKIYDAYVEKFRNVEYLEHQLEQYNQAEQEKLEESEKNLRKMQKRLKEEELKILRGEQEGDGGDHGDTFGSMYGKNGPRGGESNVYGSMSGGSDSDSDMSDVLDSDNSDMVGSVGGDLSDDLIDDDDDGDLSDVLSGDSGSNSSLSDNDF